MADTNSEPSKASAEGEKGGQQSSDKESLRNLLLILGITILLVMAVILVAFLISGIARGGQPTDTTTASTTNTSGGSTTSDTIVGNLAGGVGDKKPLNPGEQTQSPESVAPPANTIPGAETGSTYNFTAGSGDSVSWLARRAMYAYLTDRSTGLDRGQRLYFEVNLTQSSNPAPLNIGETRTFSAAIMDQIMYNVTHLSAGELSSWTSQAVNSGYI